MNFDVFASAEKKDGGFIRNLKLDERFGSFDLVVGRKVLSISDGESFKGASLLGNETRPVGDAIDCARFSYEPIDQVYERQKELES